MISISYQPTDDYDIASIPFAASVGGRTPQEREEAEKRLRSLQARGLCPHDGRELALMLAGQKPAAIITMTPTVLNEWKFWIENLTLMSRESPISIREGRGTDEREMIVVLKNETWRANFIELLLTKAVRRADLSGAPCSPHDNFLTTDEQKQLGKTLGYSDRHLDAWLAEHGKSWTEEPSESNITENKEVTEVKTKFGRFLDGIMEDPMAPSAVRLFSAALSVARDTVAKKKNKEEKKD